MALGWRGQYYRYKGFFLNIAGLYKQRVELRAFTEIVLSIATISIFLLFALKPTILTIIALAREIGEKKETVSNLDKKISDLQKAAGIYQQNQNLLPGLDTAVSDIPNPDSFTGQVVGLAAKNSVKVLGLSTGQITLVGKPPSTKKSSELKPFPEGAMEMSVSVNVQGNYTNLAAFISDLENLRIASKIDSVSVSSTKIGEEKVIVALVSARIPYIVNQTKSIK